MRIRTGTVIWAALLLALAAVAFSVAVFDLREYQAAVAAWIVVGLGGVFVIAALVALITRAARSASTLEPPARVEPDETCTPVVEPTLWVEPVETPREKPAVSTSSTRATRATTAKTPATRTKDQPVD